MKALIVARKSLVEILREPQLLLVEIALPLLFLLITVGMYNAPLAITYSIWVVGGRAMDGRPADSQLAEELRAQRYSDGRSVFNVKTSADRGAGEAALKDKSAAALLVLPQAGTDLTIVGDAISPAFYHASAILDSLARGAADRAEGFPEAVHIVEQPVSARGEPQNLFDLYAPGIIVFAILLIAPQTAMLVAREIRWKTLRRLRLTQLNAWGLLAGISLAQMMVATLQVLVILFGALAMGFHNQGSLGLAILVGLALSFSAIGMGLITACFVENDSQAANVAATFSMLMVFLSGAFYALPPITLFSLASHQIDLFDIFPATSGFLALQQVLTYGGGLREVSFRLSWTLALSLVYFAAGVWIFQLCRSNVKIERLL